MKRLMMAALAVFCLASPALAGKKAKLYTLTIGPYKVDILFEKHGRDPHTNVRMSRYDAHSVELERVDIPIPDDEGDDPPKSTPGAALEHYKYLMTLLKKDKGLEPIDHIEQPEGIIREISFDGDNVSILLDTTRYTFPRNRLQGNNRRLAIGDRVWLEVIHLPHTPEGLVIYLSVLTPTDGPAIDPETGDARQL